MVRHTRKRSQMKTRRNRRSKTSGKRQRGGMFKAITGAMFGSTPPAASNAPAVTGPSGVRAPRRASMTPNQAEAANRAKATWEADQKRREAEHAAGRPRRIAECKARCDAEQD